MLTLAGTSKPAIPFLGSDRLPLNKKADCAHYWVIAGLFALNIDNQIDSNKTGDDRKTDMWSSLLIAQL